MLTGIENGTVAAPNTHNRAPPVLMSEEANEKKPKGGMYIRAGKNKIR